MKKSIIAMAVAGALAVPAIASADATLYGRVVVEAAKEKDSKLNVGGNGNTSTVIGVRGTADTGVDGLTAIYRAEWNFDKSNGGRTTSITDGDGETDSINLGSMTTRLAHVGLTGGFGTVLGGTVGAPHYDWVTSYTDVMLSSAANTLNPTLEGVDFRLNNVLAYVSPEFSGFQAAAAIGASSDQDDKNADWYHAAVKYDANNIYLAASIVDYKASALETAAADNVWALAAGYDFGMATVGINYTEVKYLDGDKYKPVQVAGTYSVTDATTLKLAYADHKNSQKGWGAEVQHNLTPRVNTWVGYGYANSNLRDAGTDKVVAAGMRVNF